MSFDADTTTDEVLKGIDLPGIRAIVTGASGGIGQETVRALASQGAAVTIAARNMPKAEAAAEGIRLSTGNPNVNVSQLEFELAKRPRPTRSPDQQRGCHGLSMLFSVELDRRLGVKHVRSNAVHPGGIQTDLGRHLTEADIARFMKQAELGELKFKSVQAGAATSVWGATSPDLDGRGGLYLEDCHIGEPGTALHSGGYAEWARDAEAARKLWSLSEQLVGESFAFD